MTTEETLPIDAHIIAIDETEYYNIAPEHRQHISQIRGVYLFDTNQVTHCCELTPSYYLIHLYNEVIFTDGDDLDDGTRDEIEQNYAHEGSDDIYVHCHTVDGMIETAKRFTHHHYGHTGVSLDDSDYDEQIEGLREHFCCNVAF